MLDNNTCIVKNVGAAHVTYKVPDLGVRRSFAPGESKVVTYEELEKLTYRPGGMTIITNYLQIQDASFLNNIGAKVEPEYHMSEADVARLITSGSIDSFLDALDFAPKGVIELIKKLSVQIPMVDMNKRKALKAKTGFDVEKALQHIEEEKEDNGQNTILKQTATERRVQPEAAPAGRRTAAPKYNVINKTVTDSAETVESAE